MAHQYTVYKHSIKAFPEDTRGFIFSSFLDGNIWRDEFTLRQLSCATSHICRGIALVISDVDWAIPHPDCKAGWRALPVRLQPRHVRHF